MVSGPLVEIAPRFSSWMSREYQHTALVIFTPECTGRPRKVAGDPQLVERVTIAELEAIKQHLDSEAKPTGDHHASFGGTKRRIACLLDQPTGTLLAVAPKPAAPELSSGSLIAAAFGLVASSIQHQVVQASPAYLAESLAASSERARAISEMVDTHASTLMSLLATLRSNHLDDSRARTTAADTASAALIALRSSEESNRALAQEAVTTAFARLRGELDPLLDRASVAIEYVEPPADGRPVPGEVARAARAIVRTIALAYVAQPDADRVRIAWDCDGSSLLLELRADGDTVLDIDNLSHQLAGRVSTLRGQIAFEATPGWGSRVNIAIPLDPPATRPDEQLLATLNPRELEVLSYLSIGKRNKEIAVNLGISESTVKFHVASILRKLNVTTRGEAGALGIAAGIRA